MNPSLSTILLVKVIVLFSIWFISCSKKSNDNGAPWWWKTATGTFWTSLWSHFLTSYCSPPWVDILLRNLSPRDLSPSSFLKSIQPTTATVDILCTGEMNSNFGIWLKNKFFRKRNQGIINLIVKWLRETFLLTHKYENCWKNSQKISHKICKSFNVWIIQSLPWRY